jgi:hypothetical protein
VKRYLNTILLLVLCSLIADAQTITQTVGGRVTKKISDEGLAGASIKVSSASGEYNATTDQAGAFALQVPVGRYKISVSFTGFQTYSDELLVVGGRESLLKIALAETETVLQPIEVSATNNNVTDVPGMQSISIEKTMRVPANFFDPVRMLTSYPGVVAASDQANSIIVKGNSPNGLLWRLNGLDIVNPNHLANAGTLSDRPAANGGGTNILSAQMLDRTNFYTSAFPANYGNALAGVVDMKLREGNKTRNEYTAQASLIGLDFAAEGPIRKKENSSFLANYRYSTVGLLSEIGVPLGDEAISFQDFSFATNVDQKNGGTLSIFGIWGKSKNVFKAKDQSEWKEDKDKYNINFGAQTYAAGFNYKLPAFSGRFTISAAYSSSDQNRDATSTDASSVVMHMQSESFETGNHLMSTNLKYEVKTGNNSALEAGVMTNFYDNTYEITTNYVCAACDLIVSQDALTGTISGALIQPYVNFNTAISSSIDFTAGIRYLNFTYNNTSSFEPRTALTVKPSTVSSLTFAYSLISQMQLTQTYLQEGNKNLGFTRSHHFDINYKHTLGEGLQLRSGIFYQHLFNVPVDPLSTFSTINLMDAIPEKNLTSNGTGDNQGVDLVVEKYFFSKDYIMIGGTYYDSRYTDSHNIKRNTRFNGNYTFNATYGKEWTKPEKNRTIGLSTRLLYLGGLRESSSLSTSFANGRPEYDNTNPFSNKLPDYFRIDMRLSFRKNKPGYTRTFAIDIQNLTNQQNVAYHYFDQFQSKLVTKYQLGIIPVLVYRVDF